MKLIAKAIFAATMALSLGAQAQSASGYPNKPIKFIVPYSPGGLGDTFSRALTKNLSERLKQTIIVDNKPGAGQIIAVEALLREPSDGYTLLLGSMTSLSTNLGSYEKLPYDPINDVAPVSKLFSTPLFLTVNTELGVKSPKELAEMAKKQPGKLSYATLGPGGSLHLAGELFAQAAGVQLIPVGYKGSAPAVTDVMGGFVTMIFDGGSTVIPHARSGKMRILAVTGDKRSESYPEAPTMKEAGFPDVHIGVWFGLVARKGTPSDVVARLNREVNVILADPAFKQSFSTSGISIEGSTPEEFSAFVQAEAKRWPAFMKKVGVTPQ